LAHFVENHDEPRAVAPFRGSIEIANAAAAALLTLPGLRFVYQDQWNGYANKIDVHLRRSSPESPNRAAVVFFDRRFKILNIRALKTGEFVLKPVNGSDSIVAWEWAKEDEHILVAVNSGANTSGGHVFCEDAPLNGNTIPVQDLMTDTNIPRDPNAIRSQGLCIVLTPY
jgi:hypothetical protein